MRNSDHFNEAKKFLDILSQFNPDEVFHFQTFDDLKDSKRSSLIRNLVGTLDQHFNELVDLNNKGAGIFVTVNRSEGLKRDAKSIVKVRAVFADKDDGNFDSFPVEPSILVQTKNGQHAYWITDEVSTDDFTAIQKQIINTLKTDISIHDLPRVMRLPGFYHRKDPNSPFFITIIKEDGFEYTAAQIFTAFPKMETTKIEIKNITGSHSEVSKYIETLDGAVQGEGGDLMTFQVACALVRGFNLANNDALEYFKKFNEKCSPMWTESELLKKLEGARKYGSGEFGSLLKNITTEQWVHKYIEKNKVKTSYNSKITYAGEIIPAAMLVRKAEIHWDNEGKKSKINIIKSIFEEWEFESKKNIIKRTRDIIKFDPKFSQSGGDELTKFTIALVGNNCAKLIQHRAVIGHFIWQVKRKLFGYDADYHMCPVLVGRQGGGKTEALDRLVGPLKHLCMEGNLGNFIREAEKFVFGTYYIIKLDEFAKGSKSDLESMKTIMTSREVTYRTFYVQKMAVMPNVSTFIGASNRSVAEIFNDQTGNRRFYEIPCLDLLDWETIGGSSEESGLDYSTLWKSIDEDNESPIMPFISEINKYQEEFRAKTIVEEWLTSEDLRPCTGDVTEIVALKKLHLDFMNWMKIQNCNFMYTDQRFGRELSKLLEQRKRNDGSYYIVKVKRLIPPNPPMVTTFEVSENTSDKQSVEENIDKFLAEAMAMPITLHREKKS
ncbi:MAG: VapE domain-containing protein [Bdellovibrionota bacterium]